MDYNLIKYNKIPLNYYYFQIISFFSILFLFLFFYIIIKIFLYFLKNF